jgi:hypothetical protein
VSQDPVIALELAAAAPGDVAWLVVHEPPLGQFLAGTERESFDKMMTKKMRAGGRQAARRAG